MDGRILSAFLLVRLLVLAALRNQLVDELDARERILPWLLVLAAWRNQLVDGMETLERISSSAAGLGSVEEPTGGWTGDSTAHSPFAGLGSVEESMGGWTGDS